MQRPERGGFRPAGGPGAGKYLSCAGRTLHGICIGYADRKRRAVLSMSFVLLVQPRKKPC